jgi:hypothetical protein
MPKSTATCNSIINLMYNAVTWANVAINATASPLTDVEVSLHTGALTAGTDSQTENETSYSNYVRVPKARGSYAGWEVAASGATKNEGSITFAQCGASGATLTYVATGTAHTSTGHVWHYGELSSPLIVSTGITPIFADATLVITES